MALTTELVSSQFDSAKEYAATSMTNTATFMDQLEAILTALEVPDTDAIDAIDVPELTPIDYGARPTFSSVLDSFPDFIIDSPEKPTITDIEQVDVAIPTNNLSFSANEPTRPTINIDAVPESAVMESIEIPARPDITLPDVPILTDIVLPEAPVITLPDFNAETPSIDPGDTPKVMEYQAEDEYDSQLQASLISRILVDLRSGATGLDDDVEEALYARGLERQRVENEKLYRDVFDQFSAIGMTLPSGVFAARLLETTNEISRKTDNLNLDIILSQADLAQKNSQFIIDQARQYEATFMDFFNSQQNRLLDAQKTIASQAVEIFNTLVTKEKLKLEIYQTEATVFETKIKSELAAVEIYKTQIEGSKVATEIQQAMVNVYSAEVGAVETIMKLYAIEMDSAKISADIQVSKIEVFKSQVEAYVAGLSAEKLKVDIYDAEVAAEKNRAMVFGELIKSYQVSVDAAKIEIEANSINAEIALKTNQQLIDVYKADIDGYKAQLIEASQEANYLVQGFTAETTAFGAQTDAQGMLYQAQLGEMNVLVEQAKLEVQKQLAAIQAVSDGYVAVKELQVTGTTGIMNANAQLAASAMNAVNISASQSISSSETSNESISETHSYDETK